MTETDTLQTVLAGEHAAVYLFALIGARTSESGEPDLYEALRGLYTAHRDRRDELIGLIAATGASPVAAETAYELMDGLELERACATGYAAAVAATTAENRALMIDALNDAAVRELGLRGTPEMFPGADEFADR